MTLLSGDQVTLEHGAQSVTLATIGAALRTYAVGGRDVVQPFEADAVAPAFHGMVLAPWPNRLADGAYEFAGRDLQVPLTEVDRRTALHGLACWQRWEIESATSDAATLVLDLPASPGYPFSLTVATTYALSDAGLTITTRATNTGHEPLPYGVGFHPWFSPGDGPLDACTLSLDAGSRVLVDDRLLPTGTAPVTDSYDLRQARLMEGIALDDAFVDVIRDGDGLSWSRLSCPDGAVTEIWMDAAAQAWQVCTGDAVPGVRRSSVAIEPMSCIADAFRTGDMLVTLAPGESHELAWGMRLSL